MRGKRRGHSRRSARDSSPPKFFEKFEDGTDAIAALHGSTTRNAVILDEDLATYLASVPTHSGIMVARPLEMT